MCGHSSVKSQSCHGCRRLHVTLSTTWCHQTADVTVWSCFFSPHSLPVLHVCIRPSCLAPPLNFFLWVDLSFLFSLTSEQTHIQQRRHLRALLEWGELMNVFIVCVRNAFAYSVTGSCRNVVLPQCTKVKRRWTFTISPITHCSKC